ncbi:hypothetical protein AMTR_s00093p00112850 [Amborella trichopoda]|uniref:Uncharacterized protein n=1 Tax=Amborella trichopoda TaxID=13333 RepID=W1NU75_AMBTC|nr:hypothetical protein AMTR_s00093p00112850 [Amborella trichopoda]
MSKLGALSTRWLGQIDHPLDAVNAKRWRSETNSLHFNVQIGKMTPTLFDAHKILSLVVDDKPVTSYPITDYREHIQNQLGQVLSEANLKAN